MTEQQKAAHERMTKTLPSRLVIGIGLREYSTDPNRNHKLFRPVVIGGRRYKSIKEASRKLKVATSTISYWIREGKRGARHAD